MNQAITGYHLDEHQDWVAELACGHNQHVRHNPPWTSRPWVATAEGRARKSYSPIICPCKPSERMAPSTWLG